MDSSIFGKIQDAVTVAGKEIMEAAGELSSKAKLGYEIRSREAYLDELYVELGKKYYAERKDNPPEGESGASFEEIKNLLEELAGLRQELADLNGAVRCERCGAQVSQDADYCGKCGAYMHEEG